MLRTWTLGDECTWSISATSCSLGPISEQVDPADLAARRRALTVAGHGQISHAQLGNRTGRSSRAGRPDVAAVRHIRDEIRCRVGVVLGDLLMKR